jgi:hypothetical protein
MQSMAIRDERRGDGYRAEDPRLPENWVLDVLMMEAPIIARCGSILALWGLTENQGDDTRLGPCTYTEHGNDTRDR